MFQCVVLFVATWKTLLLWFNANLYIFKLFYNVERKIEKYWNFFYLEKKKYRTIIFRLQKIFVITIFVGVCTAAAVSLEKVEEEKPVPAATIEDLKTDESNRRQFGGKIFDFFILENNFMQYGNFVSGYGFGFGGFGGFLKYCYVLKIIKKTYKIYVQFFKH